MKAISTQLIISSIRSKVDGSLGITASTPELNTEEKVAFMELQNQPLEALLKPTDSTPTDIKQIKGEVEGKTPSQRLYNTIFVYWKQKGGKGNFENFYHKQMELIINRVKNNLEPNNS